MTEKCLTKEGCWKGDEDFELTITDTPGMGDINLSKQAVLSLLADSVLSFSVANRGTGVTAFCICISGLESRFGFAQPTPTIIIQHIFRYLAIRDPRLPSR